MTILVGSAVSVPATAATEDPAEARREEVQRQQTEAAARIDVLRASDAEVEKALAALKANVDAREKEATAAKEAAEAAAGDLRRVRAAEDRTGRRLEILRRQMKDVAVDGYINGPLQGIAVAFEANSFNDLTNRRYLLEVAVEKRSETSEQLRDTRQDLRRQRRRAAAALVLSEAHEEQVARDLRDLRAAENTNAAIARAVVVRLEQTLAEATALQSVNQRLAAEILERQRQLAAQVAKSQAPAATAPPRSTPTANVSESPARATKPAAPTAASDDSSPVGKTPPRSTTTSVVAPAAPPSAPRPTTSPNLATVRGITVATALAPNLADLLDASAADGFDLGGGGYRSIDAQVEARRANCGPSDYDIYEKPATECDPPTARPGQSMHEQGLAVDFTSSGRLIQSRNDPAFVWLARNAGRYGLYNLPREPWHWSSNGN